MKKNVSFWLFALSTMILAVMWACSDDGKKGEVPPGPDPEVPDVVMKMRRFMDSLRISTECFCRG